MKRIITLLTILIILIPIYINAYELETENNNYEYSSTIPSSGYDYNHTICNGTRIKDDNVIFNNNNVQIKGITEQSNCKFYFNKNGEEIIKVYEVKIEVQNGTTNENTKEVNSGEEAVFTITNNEGYSNPKVTCTNGQNGSIQNNTLTVTNITSDTTCTVEYEGNTYEVKYNSNGGSGTMSNSSHTYGTEKALSSNTFTKEGYTFQGWSTSSSSSIVAYTNGESVSNLTSEEGGIVNLYAVWKINTYTVNATVLNGTISGSTSNSVNYNSSTTFTLNPSSGYGNPTVSCTNNQTGSINGNTLTVSNVTNDTTCTVEYSKLPTYTVTMVYKRVCINYPTSFEVVAGEEIEFDIITDLVDLAGNTTFSCSNGAIPSINVYNLSNANIKIKNINSDDTCTLTYTGKEIC